MTVQVGHDLDRNTTVLAKMSKREAASLVRFLTHEIAESQGYMIDIRFDIRQEWDAATVLVSAAGNTLFGSRAIVEDVVTSEIK
jgi:hypothetical protein